MSSTRRAAVLGHPIAHSLSPRLHGAAYRFLGVDVEYTAIDTDLDDLDAVLERVRTEPGWAGLSVTMPLKAAVAERVDRTAGQGEAVGVVNTVTVGDDDDDGVGVRPPVLTGHNTDVAGIVAAVTHAGVTPRPRGAILGGGGTATAAVAALAALEATTVDVYVRDASRAASVRRVARRLGVELTFQAWDDAAARLTGADLVVATLPPRGADGLSAAMMQAHTAVTPGAVLLDAAYDPWPSAIASSWQQAGGTIVPGLEMLLYQAVDQVRLFVPDAWEARITDADVRSGLIDAMCDAVGLPRRGEGTGPVR